MTGFGGSSLARRLVCQDFALGNQTDLYFVGNILLGLPNLSFSSNLLIFSAGLTDHQSVGRKDIRLLNRTSQIAPKTTTDLKTTELEPANQPTKPTTPFY